MFVKLLSLVLITFSVTLFLKVVTCRPQMDYYQPIQPDTLVPIIDCAKIWNYANYCGNFMDVSQHQVILNSVYSNFAPRSAQVRDNCSLNIYSDNGLEFVVNANTNWLWQCWSFATAAMCCECNFGECAGAEIPSGEDSCAIVYQQSQCLTCNGFRLELKDKDEFGQLENVDNQVSSIMVKPGCQLSIYDEPDFQGNSATVINIAEYLPEEWDDNISSLKCFCNTDGVLNDTATSPITTPITETTTLEITSTVVMELSTSVTTLDPPITTITTIPPTVEPPTTTETTESATTTVTTEPAITTAITEPPTTTATTEPPTTTAITESPTTITTTEPFKTSATTEPPITTAITEPPTTTATTEPPTTTAITESPTTITTTEPFKTSATTEPPITTAITEPPTTTATTEPPTTITTTEPFKTSATTEPPTITPTTEPQITAPTNEPTSTTTQPTITSITTEIPDAVTCEIVKDCLY